MDRQSTTISTREKLGALIKRFLKHMDDNKQHIFQIGVLVNEGGRIFKDNKRALDIIFYLEALGVLMRISPEHMLYIGFRGMVRRLMEYQDTNYEEIQYEVVTLYGRVTSLRPQLLSGQLLCRIFYGLIYLNEATTKSSIEQLVEAFAYQQKDLNLKNFIPEILNILGILGLIEKNDTTEVINYVGPDLKCYDEAGRKISWKIYELTNKEESLLGKEGTDAMMNEPAVQPPSSIRPLPSQADLPPPVHMSYFPELSYAVLRSPTWEKTITDTCFFIGRTQKRSEGQKSRSYRVDLDLPYRSVSRQHAVVLFNFEAQRWQVRCLSRKNMLKVDGQRFAYGDKNVWLRNKSELQVGPQRMVFLQVCSPPE